MKATITKIEPAGVGQIVSLEWSGEDRSIWDFAIDRLGTSGDTGGNLRSGWVAVDGMCRLAVGDSIPLAQ